MGCAEPRLHEHRDRKNKGPREQNRLREKTVTVMDTNRRFSARIGRGAAVSLLSLVLLAGGLACATQTRPRHFSMRPVPTEVESSARSGSEWAVVEAITADTQVEAYVRAAALQDSRVAKTPTRFTLRPLRRRAATLRNGRIVKGRFHAATSDTLTLASADGCRHQLHRRAVRVVKIRRPFLARPPGWLALAVGTAVMTKMILPAKDLTWLGPPLIWSYTALPASLPFFFASAMQTVYTAPPADSELRETDWTVSPRTCDR